MRVEANTKSTNIREDFLSILSSVGGAVTFQQAKKMLSLLGENELPEHKYRPESYLLPDVRARRVTLDKERELVYLGSNKAEHLYDKAALWGISCVLDLIDNAGDLTSVRQYLGGEKMIDFTLHGELYKLMYASARTVPQVAHMIATSEYQIRVIPLDTNLIRPHYLILVTETEKALRNLTMKRIGELNIEVPHTIVTVSGGFEVDKPQFEYFSNEDAEEEEESDE